MGRCVECGDDLDWSDPDQLERDAFIDGPPWKDLVARFPQHVTGDKCTRCTRVDVILPFYARYVELGLHRLSGWCSSCGKRFDTTQQSARFEERVSALLARGLNERETYLLLQAQIPPVGTPDIFTCDECLDKMMDFEEEDDFGWRDS